MPVFIKISEYKEILETVNALKRKLEDAKATLNSIREIKEKEETELEQWSQSITDVEHRLEFIDKVMFEPEGL